MSYTASNVDVQTPMDLLSREQLHETVVKGEKP
jgi:hypothetical protein